MVQWSAPWNLQFHRTITAVEGNVITVDLPMVEAITAEYGPATIRKYSYPGRIVSSGVRDLNFVSEYSGAVDEDESHPWSAIWFDEIVHGFAANINCQHFVYSCVFAKRGASHITAKDCLSANLVGRITGARRYSFNIEGEANLFTGCYGLDDRHVFVTGSRVAGPNVFHDCHSDRQHSDIGPHHRWAVGLLYDGVTGQNMNVEDRATLGSGHGWSGAQVVFWNCEATEERSAHFVEDGGYYRRGTTRVKVEAAPGTL